MWPSEDTAAHLYNWANIGLIVSLVFGVASTVLVVWMGNVKEAYSQAELRDTKDRLGKAEIKAGEATDRAAQADLKRLKLENRIVDIFGPRQLTAQQSIDIGKRLGGLKGTKVDIYVFKLGSPYNSTEFSDDSNLGINLTHALRAAGLDAEVWLLESCQDSGASNLVVGVVGDDPSDLKMAKRVVDALPTEIGVWPEVSRNLFPLTCGFSSLNPSMPNKRAHDAKISIAIGRKITPLLTREMLEPVDERTKP